MSRVQEEKGGREKRVCKDQGPLFWLPEIRSPAGSCRFRLTCEECGKPHPTLFHNSVQTAKRPQRNSKQRNSDSQAKNLPITATYASITSSNESTSTDDSVCGSTSLPDVGTTTSMIVLVVVHHMDCPHVDVSVYALLDDESDSTFVTNSTLKELGLEGTEVSPKLNTMHGKESIPLQKVEGLVVQRLDKQTSGRTSEGVLERINPSQEKPNTNP